MSPIFIATMLKLLKCGYCKARRQKGRKFCSHHLAYAREQWHKHVAKMIEARKCITCTTRSPIPGQQRCKGCAEANRVKCLTYSRTHYHERVTALVAAGKCPRCPEHRRLAPGRFYCGVCRAAQRQHKKNIALMHGLFIDLAQQDLLAEAGLL